MLEYDHEGPENNPNSACARSVMRVNLCDTDLSQKSACLSQYSPLSVLQADNAQDVIHGRSRGSLSFCFAKLKFTAFNSKDLKIK